VGMDVLQPVVGAVDITVNVSGCGSSLITCICHNDDLLNVFGFWGLSPSFTVTTL
jgi:hypothetical protein